MITRLDSRDKSDYWEKYRQAVRLAFAEDHPTGGAAFCMMPKTPVSKSILYHKIAQIKKRAFYNQRN